MVEEIVENAKSNNYYDKEAYKNFKKAQVQTAYDIIDEACEELKNGNNAFFKDYLDVQSRFDKYTIRNALLIAKQLPNAMQLKDYNSWKEAKVSFKNSKPNKILIIEPGDAYTDRNGILRTPINAKQVIDVSETNTKPYTRNYDKSLILQSLVHDSPIDIKTVDSLENNVNCKWDKENNVIYICKTDSYDKAISSLATELSKVGLYDEISEISDDKAKCLGYMICKKYNVEYPDKDIPNLFVDKNVVDIKDELSAMKNVFADVNNRMGQYLEEKTRNSKNKDMER